MSAIHLYTTQLTQSTLLFTACKINVIAGFGRYVHNQLFIFCDQTNHLYIAVQLLDRALNRVEKILK